MCSGKGDYSDGAILCDLWFANNRAAMINAMTKLCNTTKRNGLIVRVVRRLVAAGRKVTVLGDRRAQRGRGYVLTLPCSSRTPGTTS